MKNTFTKNTRLFLSISGAIIVVALILQLCGVGLNLGIDFTGGSILEYSVGENYDVADVETIDAAWTLGTGAPLGPFRILDIVGLTTAYNIVATSPAAQDPDSVAARIAALLKQRIDEGKTGINAGEGFYSYR